MGNNKLISNDMLALYLFILFILKKLYKGKLFIYTQK